MRRGKVLELMRRGRQAIKAKGQSSDLIKILQSEITHELSSPRFQNDQTGTPGDFALEWDAPCSQDIVLRRKCESGEEVAISALLGPNYFADRTYPRNVMMKVCVKKPGLGSFLQLDCGLTCGGYTAPEFYITSARYLQSSSSTGRSHYTGPLFSDLDPDLQLAFKEYLQDKGMGDSLMKFLLVHLHRKEQNQYGNWLQKLVQTLS